MTTMEKTCIVPMEELIPIIRLQLEQGGKAPLQVTGNSMYPMLYHRKDTVLLEPVTEVCKGDLIFYRRENNAYILHRVVKLLDSERMICCGDNQYEPEEVTRSQVIARVTEFTRKGKSHSVTERGYRMHVWLWTGLFPVRKQLLTLRGWLGNIKRYLQK